MLGDNFLSPMFSLLRRQDWYLNSAIFFLALASFLILFSINQLFFWRQLIWWCAAFLIIFLFAQIDWRPLINYRWIIFSIYGASILLLAITLLAAPTIRHSRSWIVIGSFQFQTSELAKAALIILLSYFLARRHISIANWRTLLITSFKASSLRVCLLTL